MSVRILTQPYNAYIVSCDMVIERVLTDVRIHSDEIIMRSESVGSEVALRGMRVIT
jgi:hypothetical protein